MSKETVNAIKGKQGFQTRNKTHAHLTPELVADLGSRPLDEMKAELAALRHVYAAELAFDEDNPADAVTYSVVAVKDGRYIVLGPNDSTNGVKFEVSILDVESADGDHEDDFDDADYKRLSNQISSAFDDATLEQMARKQTVTTLTPAREQYDPATGFYVSDKVQNLSEEVDWAENH